MKRSLTIIICVILLCPLFCFDVGAGDARVVFLRDGGKGDGSSYSKAVGTLAEAYNALDLSKDCVIVVCGDFNQTTHFSYGKPYSGSVRFTSVYNGVDYSKKYGAEYISVACRFVMWGETVFDDIDLKLTGNYFFIIANCYPITLTENFNPVYTKTITGNAVDSGVSILGGFQNGQDMHDYACYEDININVYGGKNICILAFNRAFQHAYHFGTANITIGGKAQVGTVFFTSVDADNVISGNVKITVKDSAQINYIKPGSRNNLDLNSIIVSWEGGKVGSFIPAQEKTIDGLLVKNTDILEGTLLRYSDAAKKSSAFKSVSEQFDKTVVIGSADDNFVPVTEERPESVITGSISDNEENVTEDITDIPHPSVTDWVTNEDFEDLYEFDQDSASIENIIIISACGLISVCAIVIILLIRKK